MNWFIKQKKEEPHTVPMMNEQTTLIGSFLSLEKILFLPAGLPKKDIFARLIDVLHLPEPDIALRSVLAREQIGSTILDKDIAIPHARVPGLTGIHCAFGVVAPSNGTNSESEEARLCLLFVGPANDMKMHLAFLAGAATLFQDREFRQSLLHANNSNWVLETIRSHERALTNARAL